MADRGLHVCEYPTRRLLNASPGAGSYFSGSLTVIEEEFGERLPKFSRSLGRLAPQGPRASGVRLPFLLNEPTEQHLRLRI